MKVKKEHNASEYYHTSFVLQHASRLITRPLFGRSNAVQQLTHKNIFEIKMGKPSPVKVSSAAQFMQERLRTLMLNLATTCAVFSIAFWRRSCPLQQILLHLY
jgi:hypothetical protein